MPQKHQKWKEICGLYLWIVFLSNQFAIILASFQQVHYCYSKAVVIALVITVSNNSNRGTRYVRDYAKKHWRVRP